MMNKRIKKLWIKALTSGEYKQGKEQLRDGDRFCCLGVLCDIYGKQKGVAWAGDTFLGDFSALPRKVQKWAGLGESNPSLPDSKFQHASLAEQNDYAKSGFKRIAQLIEKYL
jgi:hypothetical protein